MNGRVGKIRKYVVSSRLMILVLVLFAFSLICFCLLNTDTIGMSVIPNYWFRQIVINGFLVVSSITGTNLLTSLIIEKNSKNEEWLNIISQDVLSNHIFYDYMDAKTKDTIISAVEYSINKYNNTVIQNEIMQSIIGKLNFQNETYYFNKCDYNINCEIFDNHIRYEMKRITEMYSYKDDYSISNFRIAVVANWCDKSNNNGIGNFEILINNVLLASDAYIVEDKSPCMESDIEINKYNTIKYIYLKDPLTLHADNNDKRNCTQIIFKYVADVICCEL